MDSSYAFYTFFESEKNNLYRQLSTASQYSLIWPKFFYSWFFVDERHYYNILNLRQKLGPKIDTKEIAEYNEINVFFLLIRIKLNHSQFILINRKK